MKQQNQIENNQTDKTFLVTGGSRGLGLVLVKQLIDRGWKVVSVQRKISDDLAALIQAYPNRVTAFELDLSDLESIESHFRDRWFPDEAPVQGLVNNAAIAYDDLMTNLNLDHFSEMNRVNVLAPLLLTKWVVRRMLLHRQGGSLVHISSVAAHTGFKGLAMYGATKGALESFSRGIAREWGSRQIRSNCVVPGFMETDMSSGLSDELRQKIYRRSSLQAPTDPASVAAMVGHLLSDESGSVTGQSIFVDGGG